MKACFVSLVYCNADVFRAGMRSLHETTTNFKIDAEAPVMHVLLDQHYPLDSSTLEAALTEYKSQVGNRCVIWDAGRNLGLHEGLNYVVKRLEQVLQPDDVIIAFDCDENPLRPGWADAMLRVFAADPKCGWLSLMSPPVRETLDQAGIPALKVGGEYVRIPPFDQMNTVCAWRVSAVRAAGKFTEPHAYYGGLETAMMSKFREAGYWVGWMAHYPVAPHHDQADALYKTYKRRHVGFELPVFPGSFEEFVAEHIKDTVLDE